MCKFIEEFYYGNLDPQARSTKQSEGITEQLKAINQLEWVGRMNNINQRAAEVINSDIIYN